MQQLRELHVVQVLGLSMSGACALLLSLSPQHFADLYIDTFEADSGMPAGTDKTLALGSALQRLTSLESVSLFLPNLATDAGDAEHMGAAAAVASALPHLPRLKEVSVGIRGILEGPGRLTFFGRRAAALSILSFASLAPSLRSLALVGLLQGDDKAQAKQMVQRSMPHVKLKV